MTDAQGRTSHEFRGPPGDIRRRLLAPRICSLGEKPCGGSEVVLWEDVDILKAAGIPVRVYGRAACEGAPVRRLSLRSKVPLVTSVEYCGQFLWQEREAFLLAFITSPLSQAGFPSHDCAFRLEYSQQVLPELAGLVTAIPGRPLPSPARANENSFFSRTGAYPPETPLYFPTRWTCSSSGPIAGLRDATVAGYAGQWVPRKGIAELLEAWRIVKSSFPVADSHLAGGPALWKNAEGTRQAEQTTDRSPNGSAKAVALSRRRLAPECRTSGTP